MIHGLKKPKEAFHDADLYRLYHKVSDEIEGRGGSVVRVKLDYELKRELYARLARADADKRRDRDALREEVAKRYHLKVVSGRIAIPDLRIEYVNENDNMIQRRDLELATEHYRPRGLSEKLHSRQIYTAIGKDHLRNRRDHELPHIKTRLLALDFVLAHPQERYFETAEEKRRYFISHTLPPSFHRGTS